MGVNDYDFSGWATKNNLKCADGRIIKKDAFKVQDGHRVPLVWNHEHNDPTKVLGHGILENRPEGVYVYGKFNETEKGQHAKTCVQNGDVTHLSIWANNLDQNGPEVLHGVIREVSLVLAGANPGAFIESVISHNDPMDEFDDEGIFYTDEGIELFHADNGNPPEKKEEKSMDDNEKKDKTVAEVFDTLNEEQKTAVAYIVGEAIKEATNMEEEEDDEVKHNVFEGDQEHGGGFLSHSDEAQIFTDAKKMGKLSDAIAYHMEQGVLQHAVPMDGMTGATGKQTYGVNDVSMLVPDYKSLNTPPEFIQRDMGWVSKVMSQVHRTPFSRIKSVFADITEDEARAKGYIKGKQKKEEVFATLKRTTDPQTVYKKQKLDRDDILDVTDFDMVAWLKSEMEMMLDEEVARAILIGDGRLADSEDKIQEIHIRPVVKDVALFNTIIKVTVPENATPEEIAKATIKAAVRARKKYKGSGNPTFWTTEDVITEMLLLEDAVDHRLYKTDQELSTAIRAKEIVPVEPMEDLEIEVDHEKYPLIGTFCNLADYNVGADRKGMESTMMEGFDIDYNQYKYLIEKRFSGALIKPFSAVTLVLDKSGNP